MFAIVDTATGSATEYARTWHQADAIAQYLTRTMHRTFIVREVGAAARKPGVRLSSSSTTHVGIVR